MRDFWRGFEKRADALTGGKGFFGGAGKGNLGTAEERDHGSGTLEMNGDDTKTDKTLIDRERGPRTEDPFSIGPEFTDENNPHIKY